MPINLYIHSYAWGEYRRWASDYMLPSVEPQLAELYSGQFNVIRRIHMLDHGDDASMLQAFRDTLQEANTYRGIVILCPPDSIFARGTIANLASMASERAAIAVPHLRCTPPLQNLTGQYRPSELAGLIMKHQHHCTRHAFWHESRNATWAGISISGIGIYRGDWDVTTSRLYAVTHCLPTVYAIRPNESDVRYWQECRSWGEWDRGYLDTLWRDDRLRVVGSSECACIAEITHADKNLPPTVAGLQYNDRNGVLRPNGQIDWRLRSDANRGCGKFIYILRTQ